VIALDAGASSYLPVLEGPPGNLTLRSGVVTLDPGSGVGAHSTEDFEELIIVLTGEGELRIMGHAPLAIAVGQAAYCPPQSEHDVVNTGAGLLRYVFVVAKTKV
jgi:quercetin dioxygenase-like cupin family protein